MSTGVVIVAMAAQSALGRSLRTMVDALQEDACGVREPKSLEQRPTQPKGVGEVPLAVGSPTDRFRAERLLRGTARQLLGEVATGLLSPDPRRNTAVIGTTVGGMRHCGAALRLQVSGVEGGGLDALAAVPASTVLQRALRSLPLGGGAITVSCACASALSAMAHGTALLRSHEADAVIAGGYDPVSEFVYGGFSALQLVAQGPLQPFAKEREGMKLGEGCVLFVLRRAEDALAFGLPVIAEIEAFGESSDAHHLTQPHPEGLGAAAALESAALHGRPDVLLAHATGTPGNDGAEYRAYVAALGEDLRNTKVVAMKGRLGHPLGAAGALELAIGLECARRRQIPSGAGPEPDHAEFPGLVLVRGTPQAGNPARITALAAGFGGANVAVSVLPAASTPGDLGSPACSSVRIAGWGAVSPGGRGADGLRRTLEGAPAGVPESVLSALVDRARFRRVALLPKLVIAAISDLCESGAISREELRRTPVLCATWHGACDFTERYYRDLVASGVDLANPLLFAESVPNIASGHASIGFGITAPCASVIGSRNSGLEALALARARVASRSWERAVVVAAEEPHSLVDAVLSRVSGAEISARSAAIAMLVEEVRGHDIRLDFSVGPRSVETEFLCSGSPIDRTALCGHRGCFGTAVPEFGSATAPAVAMLACTDSGGRFRSVASAEPGGHDWLLRFSCADTEGEPIS
jgi:3-oxoacyl-[acyl-carrier-protein] synthase II